MGGKVVRFFGNRSESRPALRAQWKPENFNKFRFRSGERLKKSTGTLSDGQCPSSFSDKSLAARHFAFLIAQKAFASAGTTFCVLILIAQKASAGAILASISQDNLCFATSPKWDRYAELVDVLHLLSFWQHDLKNKLVADIVKKVQEHPADIKSMEVKSACRCVFSNLLQSNRSRFCLSAIFAPTKLSFFSVAILTVLIRNQIPHTQVARKVGCVVEQ